MRLSVSSAVDRGDLAESIAAYDRFRSHDGDDTALLARVAELLLELDARGEDVERRDAALHQLSLAGTAGRAALDRLAPAGVTRALAILAEAGSDEARRALRDRIDDADPDVRAAAVLGLAIDTDRERLLALAAESSARVRAAAVARLGELAPESAARAVLEERARVDPDPSVRAAAVRALGPFGAGVVVILRERLSDPIATVRMAAVSALLAADRDAARPTLAALLATQPSAQGIEAARLLATPAARETPSDADASAARAYLVGALSATDASLRSQAAVALATLHDPGIADALRAALARETDPTARLAIARALLPLEGGEVDALAAIRTLSTADASMTALLASIALAMRSDAEGIDRVERAMQAADIPLRRVAARALARRDASRPRRSRAQRS